MIKFSKLNIVLQDGEMVAIFEGSVKLDSMEFLINEEDRTVGLLENIGSEFRAKLIDFIDEVAIEV